MKTNALFTTLAIFSFSLLTSLFAADTPEQQEKVAPLTEEKLRAFAASAQDLLSLEDEPPVDGTTAIPVTAELERDILNLLTLNQGFEDYFHLFTAKVGSYIDDQFTTENVYDSATGKVASIKYKHHYVVRSGQEHQVIGYLNCLDKEITDKIVSNIATQNGSDQHYFHSGVEGTNKYLLINLQYGFLSQEEIDHSNLTYNAENDADELYSIHYDLAHQGKRKTAEYVWIKEESHDGLLDGNSVQRNVFSLGLWVALDNKEKESDYNYGSTDSDNNQWGRYNGYADKKDVTTQAE